MTIKRYLMAGIAALALSVVAAIGLQTFGNNTFGATSVFAVFQGGTGTSTFRQGLIYSSGGTAALTSTTSPTVGIITATSTTATSTFANGIKSPCFSVDGTNCLTSSGGTTGPATSTNPLMATYIVSTSTSATSTFAFGLQTTRLNVTTGTSTSANGFSISGGCFAISGVCITSSGVAVPGGNNTDIQFNNSGSFGGNDNFTYDTSAGGSIFGQASNGSAASFGGSTQFVGGTEDVGIGAGGGALFLGGGGVSGTGWGGSISLTSGTATGTGSGGEFLAAGGDGGVTSGAGGSVRLEAGQGIAGNSNGGDVSVRAGSKAGAGTTGKVIIQSGNSSFSGFLVTSGLTADRTFTFPDGSGTFCLFGVNCAATTTANTWTGLQSFTNASSSLLTASTALWIPTSSNSISPTGAGALLANTSAASSSLNFVGDAARHLFDVTDFGFTFINYPSNGQGTTTLVKAGGVRGFTLTAGSCLTISGGTANIQVGNGTASTTMLATATTLTGQTVTTLSSNNTFQYAQPMLVAIGTFSSAATTTISCSYGKRYDY